MNAEFIVIITYSFVALVFWYSVPQYSIGKRLLVINLIFVSSFLENALASIPIIVFATMGYCAIHIVARFQSNVVLLISIVLMVLLFATTKRYSIVAELSLFDFLYSTIGLSYLLFRILHLMIDISQGAIKKAPRPTEYINYIFFFLAFVSGPIQRYQDHCNHIIAGQKLPDITQIREALGRIIVGFVKVIVVASVANQIVISLPLSMSIDEYAYLGGFNNLLSSFQSAETGEPIIRFTLRFIARSFAFLVYLYYNFSGYMDIVIGIGRLFGFRVSENFNKPFEAANFLDFWSRWHMTLSGWFKFYLFNPLLKIMAEHSKSGKSSTYLAVPAFFITFLMMGIWHGTSYAFVVYGLLLGAGISLNKFHQLLAIQFLGRRRYKLLAANFLYRIICRGLMISYFALSLSCLWLDIGQLQQIFVLLGVLGLVKLMIFTSILITCVLVIWEKSLLLAKPWPIQISSAAFIIGLLYLAAIWGDIVGFKTFIVQSLAGGGVPEAIIASLGASFIVFSWAVVERSEDVIPTARTSPLSMRVALLLFASLMYTGAAPEFVYKGF